MALPMATAHFEDLGHVASPSPEREGQLGQEGRQPGYVGVNILQGPLVVKVA